MSSGCIKCMKRSIVLEQTGFTYSVDTRLFLPVKMALFLGKLRWLKSSLRQFHSSTPYTGSIPGTWDLMTGIERWQAIQYAKGNYNPFFDLPMKLGPGTKDCPNVVPSVYDKRLVGCHCHEDNATLVYFWVHECFPRRCNCNYWFVLDRVPMPSIYEDS